MNIREMTLPDVKLFVPITHADERGFFREVMRASLLRDAGVMADFVQENHAGSHRNILRGLHYQVGAPQGKLVRAIAGTVFDVAVDMRRDSSTLGRWVGVHLDAAEPSTIWIPPGFAHGYYVLSDWAEVLYQSTAYYDPSRERCVAWNDPAIGVDWPVQEGLTPQVSARDLAAPSLDGAELYI